MEESRDSTLRAKINIIVNGLEKTEVTRAVFLFAAQDGAWLKWCDGWYEHEEPGREIRGRCGQPLFHWHSGMPIQPI